MRLFVYILRRKLNVLSLKSSQSKLTLHIIFQNLHKSYVHFGNSMSKRKYGNKLLLTNEFSQKRQLNNLEKTRNLQNQQFKERLLDDAGLNK